MQENEKCQKMRRRKNDKEWEEIVNDDKKNYKEREETVDDAENKEEEGTEEGDARK